MHRRWEFFLLIMSCGGDLEMAPAVSQCVPEPCRKGVSMTLAGVNVPNAILRQRPPPVCRDPQPAARQRRQWRRRTVGRRSRRVRRTVSTVSPGGGRKAEATAGLQAAAAGPQRHDAPHLVSKSLRLAASPPSGAQSSSCGCTAFRVGSGLAIGVMCHAVSVSAPGHRFRTCFATGNCRSAEDV